MQISRISDMDDFNAKTGEGREEDIVGAVHMVWEWEMKEVLSCLNGVKQSL